MLLNGIDNSVLTKKFPKAKNIDDNWQSQDFLNNAFSSEMAGKTISDFKFRSRKNIVPRVSKRIDRDEKRTKDLNSTMTSKQTETVKKRSRVNNSIAHAKVMNYAEIKKWN